MTIGVSHVISRCAHCSILTKMQIEQFIGHVMASYAKAREYETGEIVILCDACRRKRYEKVSLE